MSKQYDFSPDGDFHYDDLESVVAPQLPELIAVLDDGLEQSSDKGAAFIDTSLEMEHPQIASYADALSFVVAGDCFNEAARLTGYRSFHFAHMVGSLVLPTPTGQKSANFYFGIDDIDEMRHKLEVSAADYLGSRSSLDILTARFMPELDTTGEFAHVAEVIVGSTFMFIDEAEKSKALIEADVNDFRTALEDFDGF